VKRALELRGMACAGSSSNLIAHRQGHAVAEGNGLALPERGQELQ
jgi:hypothetical protein